MAFGASLLSGGKCPLFCHPSSFCSLKCTPSPSLQHFPIHQTHGGPGTGAAGDSPTAPSPCQHEEVGVAGALRGAQCWEIIPVNPDHDGSALQCPSECAGITFWCQQGSHQHHLLVPSDKGPVVLVQAHSSFLPVPHGTARSSRCVPGCVPQHPGRAAT